LSIDILRYAPQTLVFEIGLELVKKSANFAKTQGFFAKKRINGVISPNFFTKLKESLNNYSIFRQINVL